MADRTISGFGDPGAAKVMQTMREMSLVDRRLRAFSQKQTYRSQRAWQWEESASLMMPSMRNTFFYGSYNFPGIKKTQLQVDSTAMLANWKFAAILAAMLTPFSSNWHVLTSSSPYVNKNRQCRLYLESLSHRLAEMRNRPTTAFRRNNQTIYQLIGAFGNAPMFIDQDVDLRGNPAPGWRYKAVPLGQVFIETNHQDKVVGFDRWFRLTARQAHSQFGDRIPDGLKSAMEQDSQAPFDFLHCVWPNEEYDPERRDHKGKIFSSCYISLTGKQLLSEGGYRTFPMAYCRYMQNPEDPYADGPAQLVLPTLKTLNAVKSMYLKVGHRTADGVMLRADDGITDPSLKPGAQIVGGISADGKEMVKMLEFGNIQFSQEMLAEERGIVGSSFMTDLYANLQDPRMTATQVIELINQKGVFLAPTAGAMAEDYLGDMNARELDLMFDTNLMLGGKMLPPMPGLLREAWHETKIEYTSPLFKAARAGDAAGFLRTVESALEVAGQMQDPSMLDPFAFDRAWPDIADIQSVPVKWMASPEEVAQKGQARAKAKAQEQQVQAMPAQAALMKARAVVSKQTGAPVQNDTGPSPQ